MGMTPEELQYTVRLKDEASAHQEKIRQGFRGITTEAGTTGRAIQAVQDKLSGFMGWIRAGFGIGIGNKIFGELEQGLSRIIDLIPSAVSEGRDYAQTLKDIQRITGMSAQDTSIYAGILGRLGIPLSDVQRTLAMFGRNLLANEDLLHQLGVTTRDSNGALLDSATILDNTRRQFNQYGSSLQATGAAQELFSRTGFKFLEFLQLSDDEVKSITGDLERWGLVLDQRVLDAAERSNRALNNLHQGFEAIQTTIFGALEPTLTSFVNSFASFIQQNMQAIVTFAVSATNFILGLIGGLLGIDFTPIKAVTEAAKGGPLTFDQWSKSQQGMAGAAKGTSSAIDGQIKAIDRQIDAIRKRGQARQDANRAEELALNLQRAQQQLEDLRANSPFVAGLNNAEQQLALQKHARDIADAQKGVADASKAINEDALSRQERAEIDALQAKKARLQEANAAAKASVNLRAGYEQYLSLFTQQQSDASTAKSILNYDAINAAAQEWRDKGVAFAGDLKKAFAGLMDMIFGPAQWHQVSAAGSGTMMRSGGLIGALGGVGSAFDWLKGLGLLLAASLLSGPLSLVFALAGAAGGVARLAGAAIGLLGPLGILAGILGGISVAITNPKQQAAADDFKAWFKATNGRAPTYMEFQHWLAGGYPNAPMQPMGGIAYSGSPTGSSGSSGSGGSGTAGGAFPKPVVIPHGAAAAGAVVRARPGGSLWRLGEGGQDEGVFNQDQLAMMARAGFGSREDDRPIEITLNLQLDIAGEPLKKFINRFLYYQANRQPSPLVAG